MHNKGEKGTPLYWYKLAAEQGHIEAQFLMGGGVAGYTGEVEEVKIEAEELELGFNISRLFVVAEKALPWMEKAAEQGHSAAQWLVGKEYLCGDGMLAGKGFKKDNAKAFKFMKAFVEQANFESQPDCGSPFEALYFIGDAYWSGIGVEINREEAVKWFRAAASNKARFGVAGELSYYDPLTTEYLGGNAVEWYPKVHALFRLGEAYLKGQGITKDKEKARVCFKIPAENFHDKAKEYLVLLKYDLELMEENNKPSIFERSTLDIIAAGESEEIEYKETFSLNTRTGQNNDKKIRYATVREIAGFLNSRDGVLLIGVSDAQIVTGVECDGFEGNGDKYALKINDVIMSAIGDAATASCVKIKLDVIEDKTVCRIECKKSKKPVYYTYQGDEKIFIRVGSSTKEPKPSEWDKWKEDNFD